VPACTDDVGPVDCRLRLDDGGSVWRGCNVLQRAQAVGSECLPSACGATSGEQLGVIRE
jgi:hypothetical protein